MVTVADLLSPGDEGWRTFSDWASASPRSVEVLPIERDRRGECLLRLQVTTRSVMGALAWHTGGLLLDHRWLRLLGGVSRADLPDIASASGVMSEQADAPSYLIVALDVVGGRFAVNGGGLPGDAGEVAYFGPDTLDWLPLGQSYSSFVSWALIGDTAAFYSDLRWPGWEAASNATPPGSLLSAYPPLFTEQATQDRAAVSRRAVPWQEAVAVQDDLARQLADVPEGGEFRLSVEPPTRSTRWRRRPR